MKDTTVRELKPSEYRCLDRVAGRGIVIGVHDPEQSWSRGDRLRHEGQVYEVQIIERRRLMTHPPRWDDAAALVMRPVIEGTFQEANPVNENPPPHRRGDRETHDPGVKVIVTVAEPPDRPGRIAGAMWDILDAEDRRADKE